MSGNYPQPYPPTDPDRIGEITVVQHAGYFSVFCWPGCEHKLMGRMPIPSAAEKRP